MSVVRGPLVIADIAGYTRYLGGVELEHSRDVLADLLGTVARALSPPLQVAKLEGDAVFCVGRGGEGGQDLVTAIESCYAGFARRRRTIAQATSCGCDACRRIPELDLKFLAHHGAYTEHRVAGHRELVGADVVLAHRLLKNSVSERTGVAAYALLTDAFLDAYAIDRASLGLRSHEESYEDAGAVSGGVLDVGDRWHASEARSEVVVSPQDADLEMSAEVAADAERVWFALTDAREQTRWRIAIDRYDVEDPRGARGVGSTAHCVHGKQVIDQEIVDWKPPRHLTYTERSPAGAMLWTSLVEPLAEGRAPRTRVTWRVMLTGGVGQRILMALAGRRVRRMLGDNFNSLVRHIEDHPAGRETVVATPIVADGG